MIKLAKFIFYFDSKKEALIVKNSLFPEVKHKIPKSEITISVIENKLFLNIKSEDTSSLRAACNSYLRWIDTALKVEQLV